MARLYLVVMGFLFCIFSQTYTRMRYLPILIITLH